MTRKPGAIDCAQAAAHLYELLDRELTPELEAAVRAHLDECARCFSVYEFERGFKTFLEARTRTQGAPEHLKRAIFERLFLSTNDSPEE